MKTRGKIEWNKVTWYSKTLALALFVALPFIGFWYGTQYGQAVAILSTSSTGLTGIATGTTTAVGTSALAPYYSNVAEWQVDANNTAGGFSIAYPIDFPTQDNYSVAPSTDWRLGANNTPGIKYFTLTIPKVFEPQTNFSDATLTVGASASQAGIAGCLVPDQGGEGPGAAATSSITINGIQFTVFNSSNVGAGNMYQTTSYRTLHAGKCYAVEYTIHSAQIANYPSSYNLQPLNGGQLTSVLNRIVGTFKFL